MSVWDDLVGQGEPVTLLRRAAAAAADVVAGGAGPEMTHAWMFTGPAGSGRSTAARAFAATLQCERGGCGTCHACRTVLAGTHADVEIVATERLSIRTEDVRALVQRAARHPSQGRWRVLLVEDADRLTEVAAGVLLKSVEEPPARTVWLLCAPSPEDVLVTIRSRCRSVRTRVPPVDEVADLLVRRYGVDPAMAAFAARAAQSHIGMARRLAGDEGVRNRRREVVRMAFELDSVPHAVAGAGELAEVAAQESVSALAERDGTERAALLRSLGAEGAGVLPPTVRSQVTQLERDQKQRATRLRRDVVDRALQDLLSVYRDVLVLQLGAPVELVNVTLVADLQAMARSCPPEVTLQRMDAIGQARRRIGLNVNVLLALEAMTLSLLPVAGERGR